MQCQKSDRQQAMRSSHYVFKWAGNKRRSNFWHRNSIFCQPMGDRADRLWLKEYDTQVYRPLCHCFGYFYMRGWPFGPQPLNEMFLVISCQQQVSILCHLATRNLFFTLWETLMWEIRLCFNGKTFQIYTCGEIFTTFPGHKKTITGLHSSRCSTFDVKTKLRAHRWPSRAKEICAGLNSRS